MLEDSMVVNNPPNNDLVIAPSPPHSERCKKPVQ